MTLPQAGMAFWDKRSSLFVVIVSDDIDGKVICYKICYGRN
jgi:hypothetical protein